LLEQSNTATQTSQNLGTPGQPAALISGIESCDTISGLSAIGKPAKELVIWQRDLPPCFRDWLDRIDIRNLPDLRVLIEPPDLKLVLEPLLDECDMPSGNMRDLLVEDVHELVRGFADITGSELVDVRLEGVSHDACWRFHRDNVEARLLTTYRGPATEWVQPAYADQALQEQKQFEGPLERFGLYDVAIFKGRAAGPGSGIVHRSPPIEGTGHTRLLLCLNKRTVTSPEPWVEV